MTNSVDNTPLTDHNYEEVLERTFTDVPNKSFTDTPKKEVKVNTDFLDASQNFWLSHEGGKYFPIYNEGVMNGAYNARQPNFKSMTETITEALKNILRVACENEDKTPQEISSYIEMVEKSFALLSDKLDTTLDDRIDGEMIAGYLHATINSFINTNIKKKD
jgi:hypothetical protein